MIENSYPYFRRALDPDELRTAIQTAISKLSTLDFDCIVATGTSGLVFGPVLAYILGKPFIAIRKPGVDSHSSKVVESALDLIDAKWLFVDDFTFSGATFERAIKAIGHNPIGAYYYERERFVPYDN